jgi:hypothetical protein
VTRKTKELDHEKLVTVFLGPLSDRHWLYTDTDLYIFISDGKHVFDCSVEQTDQHSVEQRLSLVSALSCLLHTDRYRCSRILLNLTLGQQCTNTLVRIRWFYESSPFWRSSDSPFVPHLPSGDQTPAHSESRRSLLLSFPCVCCQINSLNKLT